MDADAPILRTALILVAQGVIALSGLRVIDRRVVGLLPRIRQKGVFCDVWLPLVIVTPLLFVAARQGPSVAGTGWVPLGAPICVGAAGLGLALVRPRRGGPKPASIPGLTAAASGCAVVLLLLGLAHELTVWTGQVCFAVAAILLWINTPPVRREEGAVSPADEAAGSGVMLALLLALAQGIAPLVVPGPGRGLSAIMLVLYAAAAAARIAWRAGRTPAMRTAGWTATLGPLLALGVLSMVHLGPQAFAIARGRQGTLSEHVAYGFGAYVPEATLLLIVPAVVWSGPHLGARSRRVVGILLTVTAGGMMIWRLTAV